MFVYRALNHSKKEFLTTYVGLRYLVHQIRSPNMEEFLSKLIVRKGVDFQASRYRNYTYYKGTNKYGNVDYRTCSAASPFALLVESFVLERLSTQKAFQPSKCVYSYRLPGSRSTSIFQYFYNGYRARSAAIRAALDSDKTSVAMLVDISSFYPSVSKASVRKSLRYAMLQSDLDASAERVLNSVADGYLSGPRTGLPIGPPLSHLFANLALQELDTDLEKHSRGRYFRYVDDMCVIVPRSEVDLYLSKIENLVEGYGYRLNEGKTHVTDDVNEFEARQALQDFDMGVLRSAVVLFLSMYPSKAKEVRLAMLDAGLNLPIKSFLQTSQDVGWLTYAKNLLTLRTKSKELRLAQSGIRAIVKYALSLRGQTNRQIEELFDSDTGNTNRRIYVRAMRKLIGIVVYLIPISETGQYLKYVQNTRELRELEVVLRACKTGDVWELLWYPGPTANMFSQLWSNANRPEMKITLPSSIAPPQRDVIATLALSGVISINPTIVGGIDQKFLNFVSGTPSQELIRHNGSYDDEISSLRAGSPKIAPTSLTSQALNEKDRIAIFEFGGQYS